MSGRSRLRSLELEPADRDVAPACEHVGCGAGHAQDDLRRQYLPESERLSQGEQAERRTLITENAADLDVVQFFGELPSRLSPALGRPLSEERHDLGSVRFRLRLVHADHDEVAVHLLDAFVLDLPDVGHAVDVDAATWEIFDPVAGFEGGGERGCSFDHLALAELSGGFAENLTQAFGVHWALLKWSGIRARKIP